MYAQTASAGQTGVIREMTGEVGLKAAGSSDFVPAQAGSHVAQDTVVSTGFKSTAIIVVGNTTLTVRPLTRLTLAEISSAAGTENLNVNLQTGRVRVDVKPPAGTRANATVQSPSATASVRGTSFEMDTFSVRVFEGSVGFSGTDGLASPIAAGKASEVNTAGQSVAQSIVAETSLAPYSPFGTGVSGESISVFSTTATADITVSPDWITN
uniref:FecR protein domain-containing protein n=1 Tax=uncultured bacterium contig00051 TaxID=1181535 RepID=A0A806KLJ8_9BACT|nr:hypothetical protein [uncultured bacterium contig00051]